MKRWLSLIALVFVAFAFVAVPVWLIWPFRPQTPRGLAVGYALRGWAPLVTLLAAAASVALAAWLWRDSRRWWRKVLLVLLPLPVLASAWVARVNIFEKMFRPLPGAAYARAEEASFVGDSDMVLAVEREGDAAAYPVRLLAYHHVVHDTVGGRAVVATY